MTSCMLARMCSRRFGQSLALVSLAEHAENAEKSKVASSSGKHLNFIGFVVSAFSLRSVRETVLRKIPLTPERREVHRQGHAYMQHRAHPDGAGLQTHEAKDNACENGSERLLHRFLEMNHAVRHHHDKDRVQPKAMPGAVHDEAAKEEFQRKELKRIHHFPTPEIRPQRFAVPQRIKGIGHLKMIVGGHEINQR